MNTRGPSKRSEGLPPTPSRGGGEATLSEAQVDGHLDAPSVARRKDEHIDVCLSRDTSSGVPTGLAQFRLEYDAMPEIDLEEVDLRCDVLGRKLSAPIVIGAMTGGSERADGINRRLARVAERHGLGMCLGSQRAMLVDPACASSFDVRASAPGLPLLVGNLGAVQLNLGVSAADVARLVDRVGADALALHLNPLQEAIQPSGDTRFRGVADRIAEVARDLPVPVIVKEVGAGLSERTGRKLALLPIAGVEVAGVGGTSWAKVESYRAEVGGRADRAGKALAGFGIPTADAIVACRAAMPGRLVVASGGLRTALDIAKAIALGADAVALAGPVLRAAVESEAALSDLLEQLMHELRIICFCVGARTIADLGRTRCTRHP